MLNLVPYNINKNDYFSNLPDDLISHISLNLPIKELGRLNQTNKKTNKIFELKIWKEVAMKHHCPPKSLNPKEYLINSKIKLYDEKNENYGIIDLLKKKIFIFNENSYKNFDKQIKEIFKGDFLENFFIEFPSSIHVKQHPIADKICFLSKSGKTNMLMKTCQGKLHLFKGKKELTLHQVKDKHNRLVKKLWLKTKTNKNQLKIYCNGLEKKCLLAPIK